MPKQRSDRPCVDLRELLAVDLVHVSTGGVVGQGVRVVQGVVPICAGDVMSVTVMIARHELKFRNDGIWRNCLLRRV